MLRLGHNHNNNQTTNSPATQQAECSKKVWAKAYLRELCTAKHWKQPLFHCCHEDGPPHNKMFTFRVVVQNEEGVTIVEGFGHPRTSKKAAAEDAAEGVLWCLNHIIKE